MGLANPRERFWARAYHRQLHRPTSRPSPALVLLALPPAHAHRHGDSISTGASADGAAATILGTRCDPTCTSFNGEELDLCCHSISSGGAALHLAERDVHDVLNVSSHRLTARVDTSSAQPGARGDFFECFAEIDVLCATRLPARRPAVPVWGPNAGDALATCRPLGVEIWQPAPDLLRGWRAPAVSDYRGGHALRGPEEALHG